MFPCKWQYCQAQPFDTESDCYNHLFSYHKPYKNNRACLWQENPDKPVCMFHIRSKTHHPDHIISHFSVTLRPVPCPMSGCDYKLRNRQEKKRHLDNYHRQGAEPPPPLQVKAQEAIVPSSDVGLSAAFFKIYLKQLENSNVKVPMTCKHNLKACISKGTRIPISIEQCLHDSIIKSSQYSLSGFLNLRNRIFFGEIRGYISNIVRQVALKSFSVDDTNTISTHRFKKGAVYMLLKCWSYFRNYVANDDLAELIEIVDSNRKYYRTFGIRISILSQPRIDALELRKNLYCNAVHLFQNEMMKIETEVPNLATKFFSFNRNENVGLTNSDIRSDMYLCMRVAENKFDLSLGAIDDSMAGKIVLLGFPV